MHVPSGMWAHLGQLLPEARLRGACWHGAGAEAVLGGRQACAQAAQRQQQRAAAAHEARVAERRSGGGSVP